LKDAKDTVRKIHSEKTKMDIPTGVAMENLISEYGITPARYHGGKLNGVDCHEVMSHAKILFEEIEALLLSVLYTDGSLMLKLRMCAAFTETYLSRDELYSQNSWSPFTCS
jgi:hypothetical protein